MKGYKTILFNALMVLVGLTSAEVTPELAQQASEAFVLIWGVGNAVLRAVTATPIFSRG